MTFDISRQYDRLYRYCYYHTHNRILAQVPYLYVIARNLCIDHYRRQGTLAEKYLQSQSYEEDQGAAQTDAEDSLQSFLITKLSVQRALSRLSEEERELLLLISVNEVSAREAGMILGISRFAVYRRLRLAQKHLRTELGKEGIDGD